MSMQRSGPWHVVAVLAALMTLAVAKPVRAEGPGMNGRVLGLDQKGVPTGSVAGAKIEFKNPAGKVAATGTTDQKGRYKVNLPPGTYTYKIQAAGYKDENAARAITLTLSEGYALHNFSLTRGKTDASRKVPKTGVEAVGILKGKVQGKTTEGKTIDIPEAAISLRKAGDKKVTKVVAKGKDPKDQGHYEVTLAAGSYQISVTAVGFKTLVIAGPQTLTGGKTETRDFVLAPPKHSEPSGQGIKGAIQVADAKSPPPKVKVSIRSLSEAGTPSIPFALDAKGAFQRDLRPGQYQVVAEAEGFRSVSSEPKTVFAGKYTVVDLRLVPTVKSAAKGLLFVATVYERLPGGNGKKPLPGATVLLRKVGDPLTGAPQGATGTDGKVSLKAAATGKHQVLVRMKGYKPAGMPVDVASGDNHAELELVKDGSAIALHVRIVEGKDKLTHPVAEARIAVSQQGHALQSGASDAKGAHSFSLPPGTYQIDVSQSGYLPARMEITLAAAEVRRDVVLTRASAIKASTAKAMLNLHVIERLKSGDKTIDRAIAGAEVAISQKDKHIVSEKSGKDGRLAASLPAGSYSVIVTKPGFKSITVPVDIAAQDVSREILLVATDIPPTKKATLNLRVLERLKSGDKTIDRAISGAEIAITQKDKRILADKSGQDGKLAVPLPAGSYTVVVTRTGFKLATVQVALTTLDVNQDIVLTASLLPTRKATLNLRVVERLKSGDKTIDRAISGAEIAITQKDKHILTDKSGQDGKLAVPLPAGSYTVVVTRTGFKLATVQVTLTTLDVTQDIVLTASPPPIK